MYRYRFTGEAPETFPSLGLVVGQGRADATLEPEEEIELEEPVIHARLEPVGEHCEKATADLAEGNAKLEAEAPRGIVLEPEEEIVKAEAIDEAPPAVEHFPGGPVSEPDAPPAKGKGGKGATSVVADDATQED